MNRTCVVVSALFVLSGCGGPGAKNSLPEEPALQLVVSDTPVALETGQSLVLQLLVIGATASEARISSPDLPAFATLQGSRLTLAPSRSFVGDYSMTLVATAGSSTSSAVLRVAVARHNTPPSFFIGSFVLLGDVNGVVGDKCVDPPVSPWLHSPSIYVEVGDAEADPVTIDAEVVPKGRPFSGTPTYTVTAPVGVNHNDGHCGGAYDPFHACIQLPFTGLKPGETYAFAVRLRDQLGATATVQGAVEVGNGFITYPSCFWFGLAP